VANDCYALVFSDALYCKKVEQLYMTHTRLVDGIHQMIFE